MLQYNFIKHHCIVLAIYIKITVKLCNMIAVKILCIQVTLFI